MLNEFSSENLMNKRSSRRDMFGTLSSFGKKAAIAAVPFGLASKSTKATAATSMFSGVLEGGSRSETAFMQISKHESAHVDFLIAALAEDSIDSPTFDFTAGGAFDPFNEGDTPMETSRAQLLVLAQAFEDTGVRAYKGQAGALMGTPYLEPALQIHSVEAKHASEIRRIRGLKGWISGSERGDGMPAVTQDVYTGEEVTSQAGIDLVGYNYGNSPIVGDVTAAVTQAFDEPMTGETASAIASLFIVNES